MGRRERRKRETRQALFEAAYELFAEYGYHETTVDEVADAAGVSRRTAFRYFPTKDSLVFSKREARVAFFRKLLHADPKLGPYEALRSATLGLAVAMEEDKSYLLAQAALVAATPELAGLELHVDREFEDAMVERLSVGARSRAAKRRARVVGAACMGVMRATLRGWLEGGGKGDLASLGEEAFQILQDGFPVG